MKFSDLKIIILCFLFSVILFGCSSSVPTPEIQNLDSAALLNKVNLGMTRESVEVLLGKPYSIEETFSKDPNFSGIEITVLYSPKLRAIEQQIADDMQGNQNIETTKSILGGTLSIIGYIIPSAGLGTSAGNSAIGVAGDLAATPLDPNSMDPNKIESALVVYRENKVHSILRRNLSAGPR